MEFSDIVKNRRACHSFDPEAILKDEDLRKIIEETSLSPSGYNVQPWEFVVIRDKENIDRVSEIAYNQKHVKDASAVVIALADTFIGRNVDKVVQDWIDLGYLSEEKSHSFKASVTKEREHEKLEKMALRNSALACMTLIYSAENLGYSTCPMMGFRQLEMKKFLNVPDDRTIALMIAIGKPGKREVLPRLPRKSYEELVHNEKFGE